MTADATPSSGERALVHAVELPVRRPRRSKRLRAAAARPLLRDDFRRAIALRGDARVHLERAVGVQPRAQRRGRGAVEAQHRAADGAAQDARDREEPSLVLERERVAARDVVHDGVVLVAVPAVETTRRGGGRQARPSRARAGFERQDVVLFVVVLARGRERRRRGEEEERDGGEERTTHAEARAGRE